MTPVAWIFAEDDLAAAPEDEVAAFLDACENGDRRLLALRYGYGLDIGAASWALGMDPGLAQWRLRGAFDGWSGPSSPAALERGTAAALSREAGPTARAQREADRLPQRERARLETVLAGTRGAEARQAQRSGLGVGSLVLIVLAAAVFMLYGAYHDVNPLMRGKRHVRLGDYAAARTAFAELGALPEARAWSAITWLAEGRFDRAFDLLHEPSVRSFLASFRPLDEPLKSFDPDRESLAYLPRGLITMTSPSFVYEPGPEGAITLVWSRLDDPSAVLRTLRFPVPDTRNGMVLARLEYPADRTPLQPGNYQWWAPGGDGDPATFTLLDAESRREIQDRAWRMLSHEIPPAARTFLRAHYYLRNQLYMQAGEHFADLALEFTTERYPRLMLSEISAALGVDPSVFLR